MEAEVQKAKIGDSVKRVIISILLDDESETADSGLVEADFVMAMCATVMIPL